MMLTVVTNKTRLTNRLEERKRYRFAEFDNYSDFEGMSFQEKFNAAFDILKEEIDQDREQNDMTKYSPIKIVDVFLS